VPEGVNVEVAQELAKEEGAEGSDHRSERWRELIEIVEVAILAVVAVATAWSGYQSAKWDGRQALLYGQATRDRFEADTASTRGGQALVADQSIFTAWLQARSAGDTPLQVLLVRRFTPPYRTAFDAWLRTDPFTNARAPAGPAYTPEYHNPLFKQSDELNAKASLDFNEGTDARETADTYVRDTVLLASVLFLVAVAQRFKVRGVRIATISVAGALLLFAIISVSGLPNIV
jgi:hypothetical protein